MTCVSTDPKHNNQTLKTTDNYEDTLTSTPQDDTSHPPANEVTSPLSQAELETTAAIKGNTPVANGELADPSLRKPTPQNPYKPTSSMRTSGISNFHQTSGESPTRDHLKVSFSPPYRDPTEG
jgi:hypothetical protein